MLTVHNNCLLLLVCVAVCNALFYYRRPSGIDKEFFVQLFVEPDKDEPVVNTQRLLSKMFQEQNITFVEVCCKLALADDIVYVFMYMAYSILQDCYYKCLDMEKDLKVSNAQYLH